MCLLSGHHVASMLVKNFLLIMVDAKCVVRRNKNLCCYLKCSRMLVLLDLWATDGWETRCYRLKLLNSIHDDSIVRPWGLRAEWKYSNPYIYQTCMVFECHFTVICSITLTVFHPLRVLQIITAAGFKLWNLRNTSSNAFRANSVHLFSRLEYLGYALFWRDTRECPCMLALDYWWSFSISPRG